MVVGWWQMVKNCGEMVGLGFMVGGEIMVKLWQMA